MVFFGGGCRGLCREWATKFSDRKKLPNYNLNSKHPPQPPFIFFCIKEGVRYPWVGQLPPLQSSATTLRWNWPLYYTFEGGDGGKKGCSIVQAEIVPNSEKKSRAQRLVTKNNVRYVKSFLFNTRLS